MSVRLCLLAAAVLAAPAFAHNHMTVNTIPATPMRQIVIRAGYSPNETAYSIVDGRLLFNNVIAAYDVKTPLTGEYADWFGGTGLTLTSDYFIVTGNLDGGNFAYEITSVATVSGNESSHLAWGTFETLTGGFSVAAQSGAASRELRSFTVGYGGHPHGQGYIVTGGWVIDATLVAWDKNGLYADSEPVTVRFDTGQCPADFNRENGVTVQDIFDFLTAWLAGSMHADFNKTNGVTVQDIFDFLTAWLAGC